MKDKPILQIALFVAVGMAWNVGSLSAQVPATQATKAAQLPPAQTTRVNPRLTDAQKAKSRGDYQVAVDALKQARQAAVTDGNKKLQAQTAILQGRTIEAWIQSDPERRQMVAKAIESYDEAIQVGEPAEQDEARNNLGVLLLRENRPAEAAEQFKNIPLERVDTGVRFLYTYNFGRALELNRQPDVALAQYLRVIEEQPRFEPAVAGAYRLLGQSEPPRIRDAMKLTRRLLAQGQAETVGPQLYALLERWKSRPEGRRALTLLVEQYAAASRDPQQFEKADWPRLSQLTEGVAALRKAASEVRIAFFDDFPPATEEYGAHQLFPSWAPYENAEESIAFAALLKKVGDFYEHREQPGRALARYMTSWMMSSDNSEAAVYTAAVLRDHRKELDPQGYLFRSVLSKLFKGKGRAYFSNDWPNILRFHVILGTIFEREGKWGDSQEVESATFQWEHALTAEERVRERDASFLPSPGIHRSLGTCYLRTGRTREAWEQYVQAAEGFLEFVNATDAKEAANRAGAIVIPLTPGQQARLERVRARIGSL